MGYSNEGVSLLRKLRAGRPPSTAWAGVGGGAGLGSVLKLSQRCVQTEAGRRKDLTPGQLTDRNTPSLQIPPLPADSIWNSSFITQEIKTSLFTSRADDPNIHRLMFTGVTVKHDRREMCTLFTHQFISDSNVLISIRHRGRKRSLDLMTISGT